MDGQRDGSNAAGVSVPVRRRFPFAWVTWLTKLIAGEDHCWYALWYKAHYKDYKEKSEDTYATSSYAADHAAMLHARAEKLRGETQVRFLKIEDQNKFFMDGKRITVSGCPDITYTDVSFDPDEEIVEDMKSGKKRNSDVWQVLIYMLVLPMTKQWKAQKRVAVSGKVVYGDGHEVAVPRLTQADTAKILDALSVAAGEMQPEATPSPIECGKCKIAECPYRSDVEINTGSTDIF